MSNQSGQCASGQHSGSTTRRPGLLLWMSKCVYSPLAEFGKQNVSSKQKRAFSAELCTTGNASLTMSAENIAIQMYDPEKHEGEGAAPPLGEALGKEPHLCCSPQSLGPGGS